ncbi:MAG: HAMP domain-containing histidine kinase [Desulfobacteraceae bacterium]|nr:HAMP domain-containing histidine kinase [Desulfobacteraceae bacterium]
MISDGCQIMVQNFQRTYDSRVKDNGKGIPAEKKNWVFLPLNTTSQKGTGLGLFINRKLVEQMKGFIWENGYKGIQFRIFIPCMEEM